MAIFNSYVKLPEGIEDMGIKGYSNISWSSTNWVSFWTYHEAQCSNSAWLLPCRSVLGARRSSQNFSTSWGMWGCVKIFGTIVKGSENPQLVFVPSGFVWRYGYPQIHTNPIVYLEFCLSLLSLPWNCNFIPIPYLWPRPTLQPRLVLAQLVRLFHMLGGFLPREAGESRSSYGDFPKFGTPIAG